MPNPWLSPLRRSYQTIKSKLLEKVKEIKDPNDPTGQLPLITDVSEGNILTVIVSLFSGIAETIHVYIDNLYRESFLSTATRYDSVANHLALIDYHPAAATASVVYVDFSRNLNNSSEAIHIKASGNYTLEDKMGNIWMLEEDIIIPEGVSIGRAKFQQHIPYRLGNTITQLIEGSTVAIIKGLDSDSKLEHGWPKSIIVGSDNFIRVDTLSYSSSVDRHFIVESDMNGNALIKFGDGKFGYEPSVGLAVRFNEVRITRGSKGNIEPFAIQGQLNNLSYSNPQSSSGGTDYEDFTALKFRAPLSVKTLGVAITKEDFLSIARMVPGVILASIEYICGQDIKIYVMGYGDATANQALCTNVKSEILKHVPYGTKITILPLEVRDIQLDLSITGRPSYSTETITQQVRNALYNAYNNMSPTLQASTTGVRISDLYALLDNLECVDYLTINEFYITPWLKPINSSQPLNIGYYRQTKAKDQKEYILSIVDNQSYIIYPKDNETYIENGEIKCKSYPGVFGNNLTIQDEDYEFTLNIPSPTLLNEIVGLNYSFTVYAGNRDIEPNNFYVPIIDLNHLTLKINETL